MPKWFVQYFRNYMIRLPCSFNSILTLPRLARLLPAEMCSCWVDQSTCVTLNFSTSRSQKRTRRSLAYSRWNTTVPFSLTEDSAWEMGVERWAETVTVLKVTNHWFSPLTNAWRQHYRHWMFVIFGGGRRMGAGSPSWMNLGHLR